MAGRPLVSSAGIITAVFSIRPNRCAAARVLPKKDGRFAGGAMARPPKPKPRPLPSGKVGPEDGCMQKQAMKSPALWGLILMAGLFVISASFIQQVARYANVNRRRCRGCRHRCYRPFRLPCTHPSRASSVGCDRRRFRALKVSGITARCAWPCRCGLAHLYGERRCGSVMMFVSLVSRFFGFGDAALEYRSR